VRTLYTYVDMHVLACMCWYACALLTVEQVLVSQQTR